MFLSRRRGCPIPVEPSGIFSQEEFNHAYLELMDNLKYLDKLARDKGYKIPLASPFSDDK